MITIHATKKLFDKLPVGDDGLLAQACSGGERNGDSVSLGEWTAHVMNIERRQCVLLVHHTTRFPVFIPAVRKPDLAKLENGDRPRFIVS